MLLVCSKLSNAPAFVKLSTHFLFTDKSFILDFTSIGTIFAFVLVCGGVLMMPKREKSEGRFNMPFIGSRFIFPILVVGSLVGFYMWIPEFFDTLLNWDDPKEGEFRISMTIFIVIALILSVVAMIKNLSLIPLMGLTSCLYLLTGMNHNNWFWFGLWFAIGLIIYFAYGHKHSKLRQENQ